MKRSTGAGAARKTVAGLRIGDLRDLMAMKIKVLAERGEARDYFAVKTIDETGGISVEEGIELQEWWSKRQLRVLRNSDRFS